MQEKSVSKITNVLAEGAIGQKLIDMGFVHGQTITMVRNAPLKDPIEVKLLSYFVSIRRDEASMIEVEKDPQKHF